MIKHKIYAIEKIQDNGEKLYIFSRNQRIRGFLLNVLLLLDYRDHFINWCKYRNLDPKSEDAWEDYKYYVRPGENNYMFGWVKMTKKDERWKHVYDNKKLKFLENNFGTKAKLEMVAMKERK